MKYIIFSVLAALLISTQPVFGQSAEQKKAEIDALHEQMGVASSPDEYEELKAQWEKAVREYQQLKSDEKAAGDQDAACKSSINGCNSAYKDRDYQGAKGFALKALEACPGNFKALYMLAKAERKLGEYSAASGHFDEAAAASPQDARPLLEKGNMLANNMDKTAQGIALLKQAAEVQPAKAADAQYSIGQIYLKQKNYSKAAVALEAAVKARPGHTKAWIKLTHTYVESKNCTQALRAATGALKDNKSREKSEVQFYQATAYRMCGQYSKAVAAADACQSNINRLRRNKSYIQGGAHYEKGLALEALERYNEAIAAFGKAADFREWKTSASYEVERIKKDQGL